MNLKKITTKILSLTLIFWGTSGLATDLIHLFIDLPATNQLLLTTADIHTAQSIFLKELFLVSFTNAISATYGVLLILKPSSLLELTHVFAGLVILIVSIATRSQTDSLPIFIQNVPMLNFLNSP